MSRNTRILMTIARDLSAAISCRVLFRRMYSAPFLDFYKDATGHELSKFTFKKLQERIPDIKSLSSVNLYKIQAVLKREGISPSLACEKPKILTMSPIIVDNRCCILREFGFTILQPSHIVSYHSIVRERTITEIKRYGLVDDNVQIEEILLKCFETWPLTHNVIPHLDEDTSSLLDIKEKILGKYLNWRLNVTEEEWQTINKHYKYLKHKPISNIEKSIQLAEHKLMITEYNIRQNAFLICADPENTWSILQMGELAGIDVRTAIRFVPAIIKNNYGAILRIKNILEQYGISQDSQRHCLHIFCLNPETVEERLANLSTMKEFQVLSKHPRALQMVVHYKKVLDRLTRLHAASKTCYTLGNLLCSHKNFEAHISGFGDKTCSRDLASVINSTLNVEPEPAIQQDVDDANKPTPVRRTRSGESILQFAGPTVVSSWRRTQSHLKRHKYCRHVPHAIVRENIDALRRHFDDGVIYRHCQVLLYPLTEIKKYLDAVNMLRSGSISPSDCPEALLATVDYSCLSPDQVLSLTLYCLERRYHFTGEGIWSGDRAAPDVS